MCSLLPAAVMCGGANHFNIHREEMKRKKTGGKVQKETISGEGRVQSETELNTNTCSHTYTNIQTNTHTHTHTLGVKSCSLSEG